MVVYGGENRQPEWYYFIPLYFFHGEQRNRPYDDNTLLIFDMRARHRGFYLSLEFLLDDIQIEHNIPEENEPPLYGFNGELVWRNEKTNIGVSYRKISNWTFNQRRFYNRYIYDDEPLSDSLGNDFDRLALTGKRYITPHLMGGIKLEQERDGEGAIQAPWEMPWTEVEDNYEEPFPTGVVETRRKISLLSEGWRGKWLEWSFKGGYQWVSNSEHIKGKNGDGVILSLRLRLRFNFKL